MISCIYMSRRIPSKFTKSKKTFVSRLADKPAPTNLGSFCAFPQKVEFAGQDKGEDVVLLVRQHPAVLIPKYLLILVFLAMPLLSMVVFRVVDQSLNFAFLFGAGLVFLLIAITIAVDTFVKWYFSVNIVTDERIVDVDFSNVLYHRFSEAQLEKIEDVSHAPMGILSSIFDYGDVYIQTAGTKPEFDFVGVPRPRDIQDTLLDLLEMKQKKQI